jgi:hypothetical protein
MPSQRHFPDGILKGVSLKQEFEGGALKVLGLSKHSAGLFDQEGRFFILSLAKKGYFSYN